MDTQTDKTQPAVRLDGRRALITGGASGIGAATARLFAQLGAQVAIADRNGEELSDRVRELGAQFGFQCNVAIEAEVDAMVTAAHTALNGLDIVVNCAGIGGDFTPTVEQELKAWQRIVDVNLRGTYLVCRAAGRIMVPARQGTIINISSLTGVAGFPRRNAYGAAKAGVAQMTRSLACEWGAAGIRVNGIVPGYIRTPMVATWADTHQLDGERIVGRTPLRRWGQAEEVAQAIAFLVSDWASFISGAIVPVDGGWTAFGGAGDVVDA